MLTGKNTGLKNATFQAPVSFTHFSPVQNWCITSVTCQSMKEASGDCSVGRKSGTSWRTERKREVSQYFLWNRCNSTNVAVSVWLWVAGCEFSPIWADWKDKYALYPILNNYCVNAALIIRHIHSIVLGLAQWQSTANVLYVQYYWNLFWFSVFNLEIWGTKL